MGTRRCLRNLALLAVLAWLGLRGADAGAAVFIDNDDFGAERNSTATVTHTLDVDGDPLEQNQTDVAFNTGASDADLDLDGSVLQQGDGQTDGRGGADHVTNPGPSAFAMTEWPFFMGVNQDDPSEDIPGNSQVRVVFDMNWNLDDGWNTGGSGIFAYQFLSLSAKVDTGSFFSLNGVFNYELDLGTPPDGVAAGTIQEQLSYGFQSNSTDTDGDGIGERQDVFLFDAAILLFEDLPVVQEGQDSNFLRIFGELTFEANNDQGESNAEVLDDQLEIMMFITQFLGVDPDLDAEFQFTKRNMGGLAGEGFSLVPLPGAAALGMLGMGIVGGMRLRRRPRSRTR